MLSYIADRYYSNYIHYTHGRNFTKSTPPIEIVTFLESLTDCERSVLKLVCDGLSSDDIALRLFVEKCTIDTHRKKAIDKWRDASGNSTDKSKRVGRQMVRSVRPYLRS